MSAISRLTVRPGPDGFVIGRPIYLAAAGAFNRAGAIGFARFIGRRGPVDEGKVRAEFVAWLEGVGDEEIGRFIAAMRDREQDDRDKALAPNPRERDLEERVAGYLATDERARERSSEGGRNGSAKLKQKGETTKVKVLSMAQNILRTRTRRAPTHSEVATSIAREMGLSDRHVYRLLDELEKKGEISFDMKGANVEKRG
jgi:hypothetical protein